MKRDKRFRKSSATDIGKSPISKFSKRITKSPIRSPLQAVNGRLNRAHTFIYKYLHAYYVHMNDLHDESKFKPMHLQWRFIFSFSLYLHSCNFILQPTISMVTDLLMQDVGNSPLRVKSPIKSNGIMKKPEVGVCICVCVR